MWPNNYSRRSQLRIRDCWLNSTWVDGLQFGRSIIGVTKIADRICHELFFEKITHDPRAYHIRFCVLQAARTGSFMKSWRSLFRPGPISHCDGGPASNPIRLKR